MGFAVFHAEKVTSSGASLGNHLDRTPGQEHSFRSADPARLQLNKSWPLNPHCSKPLKDAINDRISEGYTGKTAIRKDAVKALSLIFSGTHEDMKDIERDPQIMNAWIKANYEFVAKEFGKENIVRFVLHRDEKTPHIHAVVIPLVEGRLSAKKVLGDKIQMSKRQDRYGKAMEPFHLSRGVNGSKAVHNSEGWYLGQQKQAQEAILSNLPKFSVANRLDPSSYIENVSERLKSAQAGYVDRDLKVKRMDQQMKAKERLIQSYHKQIKELTDTIINLKNKLAETTNGLIILSKSALGRPIDEKEQRIIEGYKKAYEHFEISEKQKQEQAPRKRKGLGL